MRPILVLAAVVAAFGSPPAAAAQRFTLDTALALRSNNIHRGSDRGPMGLFLETEGDYRLGQGFAIVGETRNYFRLDGEVGLGESHYQLGLLYEVPLDTPIESIETGWRYYNITRRVDRFSFPAEFTGGNDTQEWYWAINFDLPGSPRIAGYHDYQNRVGFYLETSIEHTYQLGESGLWEVDTGAWVGLDWGRGVDTFRDAGLHLGLFWTPLERVRVGPTISLHFPSNQVDPGASGLTPVFGFEANWQPLP